MEQALLNYGGWIFIGLIVIALVAVLKAGYMSLYEKWQNAFNPQPSEERSMTRKETIELINTLSKQKEQAEVLGTPNQT